MGVREVFEDLVKRILETPELWAPVTPDSGKRGQEDGMPGTIDLNGRGQNQEGDGWGGCGC